MIAAIGGKRPPRKVVVNREDGGFGIAVDGKMVCTPGGRPLIVPDRSLATAIAAEWRASGGGGPPATLPLNRLVNTALDRIDLQRPAIVAQMVTFGASDMLCYRADAPADLIARQHRLWQPLLDWARLTLQAPLRTTSGIVPISQPPESLGALQVAVDRLNLWHLTALQDIVSAFGSLVLGLALIHRRLGVEEALAAALLDENFQAERWGVDPETRLRHALLHRDVTAAALLLSCP